MRRLHVALALALAGAGCGRSAVDVPALIARCGLDCAADELTLRLARSPRDRELHARLAVVEDQRGRPGAALASLDRAAALGRPFRGGVGGADRARLARLLIARAEARVARGSPGADADVGRARGLGAAVAPELAAAAARAAILVELRHTAPGRRAAATLRLTAIDPPLAVALTGRGDAATTERAARWLAAAPARRVLHEMLDAYERRVGVAGFAAMTAPAWVLDRWLEGRRWWHGDDGRPDLATLDRALAAGADRCVFPRTDAAWQACATAPVEVPGLAVPIGPPLPATWPALAVELASADPAERAGLTAIADAFLDDPARADRAIEDVLARSIDVAAAAPVVARLMALLGDPARARALWQRAVDADPRDPALRVGLTLAAADVGDADLAMQLAIEAAAASGDGGGTMLALARGLAVTGPPVAALVLARAAFELAPPGADGPAAALAAALLDRLDRHDDAAALRARARTPSAWDLEAERAAIAGWRALAAEPGTRPVALAGLRRLAGDPDGARQRLAAAALRDLLR